ncbi:hypothetical protein VMCG_10289 [Cytospora schulzeri]|uniref:Queuine tRNA-ribosyltransferase accessory subunit 2 n=1 Tax=Cytospora schulzeri TaxID=448051 RepID=A0A423VAP6_9PEZI|nr:hypothetical protein VMCG_10289 [Valsa malicola]
MCDSNGAEGMKFDILKAAAGDGVAARVGRLTLPQRQSIETPNFFAVTSRGVVPHLTPDTIARYGRFSGVYMAMEDMVEKSQKNITKVPAAQKTPAADGKRLHAFTALPSSYVTILGPRRSPAVKAPTGNNDKSIQIFTSNGFRALKNDDYTASIMSLKPDIAIALADIYHGSETTPQAKSLLRMCDRTEEWMTEVYRTVGHEELRSSNTSIFAPTLPAPYPMQWQYLECLADELLDKLSGLAIYDVDILPDLINHPSLTPLPRLSLDSPANPHEVLRQISLGIDTFLLPFLNTVTDAGVALTFAFPATTTTAKGGTDPLPLGTDLTEPEHMTSVQPLVEGCTCYACTQHHRAYVHHLLNAREMLAWVLLQIHNHHVMAEFFAGARASLTAGDEQFEADCKTFFRTYEVDLPAGLGTRPRARGYHFKAEFGDPKRNKPAWGQLDVDDEGVKNEAVEERLQRDVMETPLVPDADAAELVREGFAEIDINKTA